MPPERRLPVAMFGSIWLPICLFSFGATSMPSIHWIVPIICSSFFSVGTFLLFQSVLNYLQDAYPEKAASVLAGNDFFRSMMGACFPLFAIQMFQRLGFHVFWGCVLLGCLTILFVPIPFVLYRVSGLHDLEFNGLSLLTDKCFASLVWPNYPHAIKVC